MMTKRIFSALLAAALSLSLLAGCGSTSGSTVSSAADGPQRYSTVFYDVFDTVTQVIAYCDSEEEFTAQMDALHADLVEYNQLYDIYNDYDGVTNIKTINDNAGIAPVTVDDKYPRDAGAGPDHVRHHRRQAEHCAGQCAEHLAQLSRGRTGR